MDGIGRRRARRRPEALQRNSARARQHLATDVDANPAGPRTGWACHAYRVPDHSAARRLRTDEAWTIAAQAGQRAWPLGPAKSGGHRGCAEAVRRGREPGAMTPVSTSI